MNIDKLSIEQSTKFWVVTKPTNVSTLGDIIFECDIKGLGNQFRGGLNSDDIVGWYDKETATRIATDLMRKIKQ